MGGPDEAYWVRGESLQMKHTHLPTLPKPTDYRVINIRGDGEWWQVVNVQPDFRFDTSKGKRDEKAYRHCDCTRFVIGTSPTSTTASRKCLEAQHVPCCLTPTWLKVKS